MENIFRDHMSFYKDILDVWGGYTKTSCSLFLGKGIHDPRTGIEGEMERF